MPGICPSCNRQSTVESEFCPACGAPMNPDAQRIKEERINNTQILLPMKWHKFLTRISLPLGFLMNLYNLYLSVTAITAFRPEAYPADILVYTECLLWLPLIMAVLLIPAFILAEINLLKMRWRGVRAVLFIYLSQAVYSLLTGALMLMLAGSLQSWEMIGIISELSVPAGGMVLMFFLVRLYYNKRRQLFSK